MKQIIKYLAMIMLILIVAVGSGNINKVHASTSVPFQYVILPTEKNLSIIDTNSQKELEFKLYENVDEIYYNGKLIETTNEKFNVDVSSLSGKNTLTFTNQSGETVSFCYYFSNKEGKVSEYILVEKKNLETYVTTYKDIKIIYSSKEAKAAKVIIEHLKKLPDNVLKNVDTIKMIPYNTSSNTAAVTKDSTITLYKFSKYNKKTQMNVLYHEVAHTWAKELMKKKLIDFSYTEYSNAAIADKNYVSKYSKRYIKEKKAYNEDFAESVAFYFINEKSFARKYDYRYEYLKKLIELDK